jgi:hypothetical protein
MIRRGSWLLLGAVLGISGYRRLTRAAKALMPQGELASQLRGRAEATGQAAAGPSRRAAGRAGAETIAFVRDVRTGMADYLDRHSQI